MVGEALAYHIAKWNGNTWSALGKGMNGTVATLATSGTDLYAGGAFTTADGVSANNIAKWNGNSWSALGAGVNDGVSALAVSGTDLYAGGFFTLAGGEVRAESRSGMAKSGLPWAPEWGRNPIIVIASVPWRYPDRTFTLRGISPQRAG